jgi:hypothetical protein
MQLICIMYVAYAEEFTAKEAAEFDKCEAFRDAG